jgi:hypothetical protein
MGDLGVHCRVKNSYAKANPILAPQVLACELWP